VGPGTGHYAAFQPGAGIAMGYDDLKVIEAHDFLLSIAENRPHGADLHDAVRAAVTLDALSASSDSGGRVDVQALTATAAAREGSGRP
jgi:predicted dehydrogenase